MELISFPCPACNTVLKVRADMAGRRGKCKCGAAITIPTASVPAVTGGPPGPPPMPAAPPPLPPAEEEEGGTYTLKEAFDAPKPPEKKKTEDDEDADEDEPKKEGGGPVRMKGGKRPKAPRARALVNPDAWLKVCIGIQIVASGIGLLALASILLRVPIIVGLFHPPEYASLALRYATPDMMEHMPKGTVPPKDTSKPRDEQDAKNRVDPVRPEYNGATGPLSKAEFLIGIQTGEPGFDMGMIMVRIGAIVALLASLILLAGYGMCLPAPERFGTRTCLFFLFGFGAMNLIFGLVFRLLPAVGAFDYTLIPVFAPEISMTNAGLERITPINLQWSAAPFWEYLLALVVWFFFFLEPILFCCFLRAVALQMRNPDLDQTCQSMVKLGLGTAFCWLCYMWAAVTGTSDVLLWLLRVLYVLASCFLVGQLIWFTSVFLRFPGAIKKELDMSEVGTVKKVFDQYRDPDEDDEDDDDEDDD